MSVNTAQLGKVFQKLLNINSGQRFSICPKNEFILYSICHICTFKFCNVYLDKDQKVDKILSQHSTEFTEVSQEVSSNFYTQKQE